MKLLKFLALGAALITTALILVVVQNRPAVAVELDTAPATRAGNFLSDEFEVSDSDWAEDFPEESKEGSPSRPGKVAICHKGMTLLVSQNAVPAHLAHGDTLGPCATTDSAYTIVCHNGKSLVVSLAAAASHVAHGDSLGMCDSEAGRIMCNGKETVTVRQADVEKQKEKGWTVGPCQGKEAVVMCRGGKTIVVPTDSVVVEEQKGATFGPCPNTTPKKDSKKDPKK